LAAQSGAGSTPPLQEPAAAMPRRAFEEAAAGAAAGVAGTVLGYPLDTVKARLQVGRSSAGALACVRKIAAQDGMRGFYRGIAAPLLSMTFLNTMCFQSYAYSRTLVGLPPVVPPSERRRGDGAPAAARGSVAQRFAAGALVAPLVTVASTPFELVKVQLQLDTAACAAAVGGGGAGHAGATPVRRFTGAAHAARTIAQQRGVRALWLGALRKAPAVQHAGR
jgi:solute carrier family 25 carnitine/acylcarnitine transporter 20/29